MNRVRVRLEIHRFESLVGYTQELDLPLLSSSDAKRELLKSIDDLPEDAFENLRGGVSLEFWSTDENAYRDLRLECDGMTRLEATEIVRLRPIWELADSELTVRAKRLL